jgi:4-amino-4-deoxy-L-arabinose transferase-like glycosyltransferase
MRLDVRWLRALLVAFALAVFLPGQGALPAGDRDESRFAQATKQMAETGDYLRIMNGAEPRNKKPIGIYWLQAPFALAAGPAHISAYRMPSVLGGIAAVLATFEAGLLLSGVPAVGALASVMLAGSVILAVESHIAKTDAALLGATTIVMAILARAWLGRPVARWRVLAFWMALAAGILIKGPITPMVAGLAAGALCLATRRAGWLWALRPGWGVPLMVLAVVPWFVAIGFATGGRFFAQAVGGDLGRKLAGGSESHGGFPGLHLLLLPLLAFPATLPVLRALPVAWTDRRDQATQFLLAWLVPSWLVFEAVPTKLPHYTLPLYPAVFLLAARVRFRVPAAAGPAWMRLVSCVALVLASAIVGGGAIALPVYLGAPVWLGLPALSACLVVSVLAWRGQTVWALAMAPCLYAAVLWLELPALDALWIAPRVEAVLRAGWPGWNPLGKGLVAAGYAEPSLMFDCGTELLLAPDGAAAARDLGDGRAAAAIVAGPEEQGFVEETQRLGLAPARIGEVRGFNYSRGRWVTLGIFVGHLRKT